MILGFFKFRLLWTYPHEPKKNSSFKYRIAKDLSGLKIHDVYCAILLRYRIYSLKKFLNRLGVECKLIQQYRSKETAHRWSTAYQIYKGNITLGDLRRLKKGEDEDGNLWYKSDWDPGGPDGECAKVSKKILNNSIKLGQVKMHYAEEGYELNNPRRYPNISSVPVSNHVSGRAIDFRIDWDQLGGPWSAKARQIISQVGLLRPYKHEHWHFELDINQKYRLPFFKK